MDKDTFSMMGDRGELYQRIQDPDQRQPYSQGIFKKKLARENGWSLDYTQRVIDEYQKFVFLAVIAAHTVVPSDAVDQVWHTHLGYTRSYWHDFCPQILGMPLHHDPGGGGRQEQARLLTLYSETLASYQTYFGYPPPQDIWPKPSAYWRNQKFFTRINRQKHWVLPKPNGSILFSLHPLHPLQNFSFLLGMMAMLVAIGGPAIAQIANPLNMTGPNFLAFYIPLSCFGILIAYSLHANLRMKQNQVNNDDSLYAKFDPYEIAFLAGGDKQVMKTAIANLTHQDLLKIDEDSLEYVPFRSILGTLVITGEFRDISHPVEKEVMQLVSAHQGKIEPILKSKISAADDFRCHLQDLGLLLKEDQAFQVRFYPCLIVVIFLVLGASKMVVGILREKPVLFLILCLLGIIVSSYPLFLKPRRSYNGDRLLQHLREQSQALKICGVGDQIALAVALFGVSVLRVEPALANLYSILGGTYGLRDDGRHNKAAETPTSWFRGCGGGGHGCAGGGGGGGSCGGGGGGGGCGGCGGP